MGQIKREHNRQPPSEHDLRIWAYASEDLLDKLYTGMTGYFQKAGHRLLNRWAYKYKGGIVLDIGCGHGHHLVYGQNNYRNYIGLDIEYKYLNTLQQRFPMTRIVNGDAYQLPFQDRSIDCVLSVYNLEHIRELFSCLAEINRVLKHEGELLVALPTEGGWLYRLGRQLSSKAYMERKYGIDYDAIISWEHWNTYKEIIDLLQMAQFQIIERHFIPFNFFPWLHLNIIGCLRLCPVTIKT